MALNLKNREVERLAADVARLTGESKTEAIRRALEERRRRLTAGRLPPNGANGRCSVCSAARSKVWPTIPKDPARTPSQPRRRRRCRAGLWTGGCVTLDTSALVTMLSSEPGYLGLVNRMLEADVLRVGAPTLVETSLVFAGKKPEDAHRARDRRPRQGTRGDGSALRRRRMAPGGGRLRPVRSRPPPRAVLFNFGDCLAYATAAAAGDSLLFVGDDFAYTDVPTAH